MKRFSMSMFASKEDLLTAKCEYLLNEVNRLEIELSALREENAKLKDCAACKAADVFKEVMDTERKTLGETKFWGDE